MTAVRRGDGGGTGAGDADDRRCGDGRVTGFDAMPRTRLTRRAMKAYVGGRTGDGRADGGGDDDGGDDDMRAPERQGEGRRVPCGGSRVSESLRESPRVSEKLLTMTFDGDGRRDGRRTGDGRADGVVVRERRSGEGGGGEGLRALTVGTTGLEVWKVYKIFLRARTEHF